MLRRSLLVTAIAASMTLACASRPSIVEVPLWEPSGSPATPLIPLPGGRVVAVTVDPGDTSIAIAATSSGGLFKTRNGGHLWSHIDSFRPNRLWDVQYDPDHYRTLIATVGIETHQPPLVGIWRSTDAGATWTRPASANFPPCGPAVPARQAYGRWISFFRKGHVFVGTDCGIAVSHDHGRNWTRVTLNAATPRVTGVVARPGQSFTTNPNDVIVDACAADGVWRSTDAGATFQRRVVQTSYPRALDPETCFLAASPDEPNVLFAAQKVGGNGILWESDDGGATWTQLANFSNPGRYPWVRAVRVPPASAPGFTVFFHAGADIFVVPCSSAPGSGLRCGAARAEAGAQCALAADDDGDGFVNEGCPQVGPMAETGCTGVVDDDGDGSVNDGCPAALRYHGSPPHDYGGMAVASNGCPVYLGNDHGMLRSSDCGQTWTWSNEGFRALQIYDLAGTVLPDHLDLYFGTQDNYVYGSRNGGAEWSSRLGPEGLWLQAPESSTSDASVLVTYHICYTCSRQSAGAHFSPVMGWPRTGDMNPPGGGNPPFVVPGSTGTPRFVQLDGNTLFLREPGGQWTGLAPTLPAVDYPQLFVAGPSANPTVYAITDRGTTPKTRGLLRVTGIPGAVTVTNVSAGLGDVFYWSPDENPFKYPHVVGVAPSDARYVAVGDRLARTVLLSADSGATWFARPGLTSLLTLNGALQPDSDFLGLQAHVVKYNPATPGHILVGTEAAGVIESCDAGRTWHTIEGSLAATAVSDFFFDTNRREVFVATYGRGLWKIRYPAPRGGNKDPCWQADPPARLGFRIEAPSNLRITVRVDQELWGPALGNGGTTGMRVAAPGFRRISVSRTSIRPSEFPRPMYRTTLGPPCGTNSITLVAGQTALCDVRVTVVEVPEH